MYRLAYRLAGNKAGAEDLFQDLLIKAYTKLDELVTLDNPGSWLARVLYNLFIDERRRYARQRLRVVAEGDLPGDGIEGLPGPDDPAWDQARFERINALDRALAQISEEHRLVVLLHDSEGYKISEIQELTGIAAGTIKSRLHRARARLRDILEADGTFS